ncbi:heptaprenyl diphosphate synthase [Propionibacterium cyclohexanicum]|uniref:Heptaprenyl diphosphate synthase n=1 Tax=Propionibacterium cyclohexanicum TaxID=64702 RepID=A0A1H9TAT8_9ACTN|nr:polyprenyl synthetase family protein [Propionibacterium cyclohexanicum]SER94064.1 heptaprenyl diphosphate synthase [Propionibacterium cyclohexanicum]
MTLAEDEAFRARVEQQLEGVERRLGQVALGADNPFIAEASRHVINAGGKRFRPLLVALTSHLGPQPSDERMELASAVVELTHVASLYHDDVMDEASMRRGVTSANVAYGNSIAIMVGDWLFSRASSLVTQLGTEFVRLQADTFSELVAGQIGEMRGSDAGEDPLSHYLDVIAGKTGALIRTSVLFGAMTSHAEPRVLEALGRFGMQIGMVFQLSDDLIDITSTTTGKTPGTDLREHVATLPILLLDASEDPEDEPLKQLLADDLADDRELARALSMLRASHVIEEARDEIMARAEAARAELAILPQGPARRALDRVCDEVVSRSH